jgi:hypothetical protein
MTHDELLEFVNKDIDQGSLAVLEWFPARSLFALRAVMELHQPWISTNLRGQEILYCRGCWQGIEDGFAEYPCPTIQAITEELE